MPDQPIPPRSRPISDKERLNRAYAERNALAVAFCKAALLAGLEAGRAFDNDPRKKWSDDWRHVVYVTLPGGEQVSWHMSPDEIHLLDGLPQYPREWDGTFVAKSTDWPRLIQLQSTWKVVGAPAAGPVVVPPVTQSPPKARAPAPDAARPMAAPPSIAPLRPSRPAHSTSPTLPFSPTQAARASQATLRPLVPAPMAAAPASRPGARFSATAPTSNAAEVSTDQVETIARQINASFVGPRAVRIDEFASYQAALSWLVRNRNTIVEGACISVPGKPVEHFSVSQIKEISARQAADAARAVIPPALKAAGAPRVHQAAQSERTSITSVDIDVSPTLAGDGSS